MQHLKTVREADISHDVERQTPCPTGHVFGTTPVVTINVFGLDLSFGIISHFEPIAHQITETANVDQYVFLHSSDGVLRQSLSEDASLATMHHRIHNGVRTITLKYVREGIIVRRLSGIALHSIDLFESFDAVH